MNLEKTSVPAPNVAASSGQGKFSKDLQRELSTSLQPDIAQTAVRIRESRRRRQFFQRNLGIVLALVLIGLYLLSLMVGKTFISLSDIWRILNGENLGGANFALLEIRLPRATLAVLAGIAYGISGYIFQTLLRNQLASPDIIGISAGASAAGVAGIVLLGLGQTGVSLMALAGALAAAILIYLLAFKGGFSGTRMILLGIGVSSMLMSFVTYILSRAERWDLSTASRWLTGSLNGASWARILPLIVVVTLFVPLLLILRAKLGVLQLGDELAIGLGLQTKIYRVFLIVGAVTLVAVATSACGPVSFVAFMAGPIAMRLSRNQGMPMLTAGLVGALIMIAADYSGQYFFGARYPVGVVTGLLGAPFLIYLLIRAQNRA